MASVHTSTSVVTIERFIMEQERLHPEATGELSNLLYDLCLAAKIISRHVRRAGLTDILGAAGAVNVSGDLQQKLDLFARDTVRNAVQHTGRVCVVASEEDEEPMLCPKTSRRGKYVIMYDPLDGSTNIDVNVSIGTIFSIHKRVTNQGRGRSRRLPPGGAEAGRRGLYPVRLEHHAGLYHRPGGARFHARSHHRRVSVVASRHPHASRGEVLQREREQLEPLDAGSAARGGGVQERRRPDPGEKRALH